MGIMLCDVVIQSNSLECNVLAQKLESSATEEGCLELNRGKHMIREEFKHPAH